MTDQRSLHPFHRIPMGMNTADPPGGARSTLSRIPLDDVSDRVALLEREGATSLQPLAVQVRVRIL